MDLVLGVLVFVAKVVVVVIGVLVVIGFFFAMLQKNKEKSPKVKVKNLNKKWQKHVESIKSEVLSKKDLKQIKKKQKEEEKKEKKNKEKESQSKKTLYVLSFKGDIKASQVKNLRQEISALLGLAKKEDEVVVRLESPGGTVIGYGLAASQMMRLKEAGLKVTVCVDKVAASGGYMMACTAHHIVASPFAILGSIGVVSSLPNFHRLLKEKNIDYLQITAGEYKRTVTLLGEVTEKAKNKAQEQVENIHTLFKNFVSQNRDKLDLSQVATGEYWFGSDALRLKLVDEIKTSDEYLFSKKDEAHIYEISIEEEEKKPFLKKLIESSLKKALFQRSFLENLKKGGFKEPEEDFKFLSEAEEVEDPKQDLKAYENRSHRYEDLMFL